MAQVPGHNKKALRRGGDIIAPFCLPVNRYLKICPTTAHLFAAGSRSVPDGVAEPLPYRLTLPLWCLKGGEGGQAPANRAFRLLSCPHPPDPLPGGKGETLGYFMQGASPLASPRLNPCGTCRTCQAGVRRGARRFCLPDCFATVGARREGTMVLVAGRFFTLTVFLPPSPPTPFPTGRGEIFSLFRRGLRPRHPCTEPLAALINFVAVVPCGGVPSLPPANPTFSFVSCPPSPKGKDILPPSRREGGSPKVYFAGGFAPGTPALNRLRHWLDLPRGRAFSLARLSCL